MLKQTLSIIEGSTLPLRVRFTILKSVPSIVGALWYTSRFVWLMALLLSLFSRRQVRGLHFAVMATRRGVRIYFLKLELQFLSPLGWINLCRIPFGMFSLKSINCSKMVKSYLHTEFYLRKMVESVSSFLIVLNFLHEGSHNSAFWYFSQKLFLDLGESKIDFIFSF